MRTDRLIDMLSTNLEPADRGQVPRALVTALALGAAVTFGAMLVTLGLRADLLDPANVGFVLLKLAFTLGVAATAAVLLMKLVRPGGETFERFVLAFLPLLAMVLLAAAALVLAHWSMWSELVFGEEWLTCLVAIPLFAALPFALLIWALRKGASTDLTRTGAIAGLVAGALGATAYALHCPDDTLPFIAVWYGGTITLCTLVGAKLGPRLLRW